MPPHFNQVVVSIAKMSSRHTLSLSVVALSSLFCGGGKVGHSTLGLGFDIGIERSAVCLKGCKSQYKDSGHLCTERSELSGTHAVLRCYDVCCACEGGTWCVGRGSKLRGVLVVIGSAQQYVLVAVQCSHLS